MTVDNSSDSYRAGYQFGAFVGRFLLFFTISLFAIALIYLLTGHSGPRPWRRAFSQWWVWVASLISGIVLALVAGYVATSVGAVVRQAELEASATAAPSPSVPAGWSLVRDQADGFEVALPAGWETARTGSLDADLANLSPSHADAAAAIRRLAQAMSPQGGKLIAVDPTQPSGYFTNVIVLIYDAGVGPSLDAEANAYITGIEQNADIAKGASQTHVSLPIGQAVRIEDHSTGGFQFSQVSYVFLHARGGTTYGVVLLFDCASDQLPAANLTFSQAVNSFRYLD